MGSILTKKCDTNVLQYATFLLCQNIDSMEKIRLIFDRRKKASRTVKGSIEIVITLDRQTRKYLKTDIECFQKEFKNGKFAGENKEALTAAAAKEIARCEKTLSAMRLYDEPMTLKVFNVYYKKAGYPDVEKIEQNEKSSGSFLEFMEEEITHSSELRETTKRHQQVVIDALVRFKRIETFSDLTLQNIMLFDRFLRREGKEKTQPTIHNYHKVLKKYVRIACKFGFIQDDPYLNFEDKRGRSKDRQALDLNELEILRSAQLPLRYAKARDLFIFQAYTGLSYSDLRCYKPYDTEEHNGMTYIIGKRGKTGVRYFTPMLPPAKQIYEKYEKRLPLMAIEKYNVYLHYIEHLLGFKKSLTSHVARHTFATAVMLGNNVPIEVVSKMLGHTDIKTTQIYAKVMDSQIEKSVTDNLIGKIK